MSSERILDELKHHNPSVTIAGKSPFQFVLEEFDVSLEGEMLSVWDPISQPFGKRRKNFVYLIDNTYFASITHHLIQHQLVAKNAPSDLDIAWISTGAIKKCIAEHMFYSWPCRTAIALMIEYLMEFEALNLTINELVREQEDIEKLIGQTSRASTASASYHEIAHFLYPNNEFRKAFYPNIQSVTSDSTRLEVTADLQEEIFCDSFGLYMTAVELISDGCDWQSSLELSKASLYGGHMTLLCQRLARSNVALNEPDSGLPNIDAKEKIAELDFRFETAANHTEEKLRTELEAHDEYAPSVKLPIVFAKDSFVAAVASASDLPCRDIGVRRISSILADGFMQNGAESFRYVMQNAQQYTKTGSLHSFDSLNK